MTPSAENFPDDLDEPVYNMDPVTDEELTALADELFQALDREEEMKNSTALQGLTD